MSAQASPRRERPIAGAPDVAGSNRSRIAARPARPLGRSFGAQLVAWYRNNGRHDLPWQRTRDPYAVWVAEIMLQQTRVATVIPYYRRFLQRFPDLGALAAAPLEEVLQAWSGLGYYSRARNLHRAAQAILRERGGCFPTRFEEVAALPGIGRSTAGAILVFARGARHAILDGNVKRVLARRFGIAGDLRKRSVSERLWRLAERLLPKRAIRSYTQALMDLGATVCTPRRPRCALCPVRAGCVARRSGRIEELPAPRRRARLPHRRATLLALTRAGEVLLEKRPPAGVWAGLWSLPEAAPGAELAAQCRERFGAEAAELEELPPIAHGFTHFRLDIRPWHVRVGALAAHAAEPGRRWLPLEQALQAALPAPVRRLLAQLASGAKGAGSAARREREAAIGKARLRRSGSRAPAEP